MPGKFVLTGSQQLGLLSQITQTLAGRVGLVQLLPFAWSELDIGTSKCSVEVAMWRGQYPPVIDRGVPPGRWYADYMATYIERDVRRLINVRDLNFFRRFVRMCAARTGQLVNLSSLAADCGITHNTAKAWLSVLEASYIVRLITPYHRSFGKRLVKAPKLYFLDTGLAASLAGIRAAGELDIHPMRGALFETWVFAELLKYGCNRGTPPELHFWRDSGGNEVDFLSERQRLLHTIEAKSGRTIAGDYLAALERFRRLSGSNAGSRTLVYAGDSRQERDAATILGWREIDSASKRLLG
jgi:hypothetical protein